MIWNRGIFWAAAGLGAAVVVVAASILWRDFPMGWPGAQAPPITLPPANAAAAPNPPAKQEAGAQTAAPADASQHSSLAPAPSTEAKADASAPPAPSAQPASNAAGPQRPSFDVVSVEPTGDTVIAGRAAPKASVELRADGKVVALANADETGQFAMLPPPLPPGDHRLQLASRLGEGEAVLSDAVPVEVPAQPAKGSAVAASPARPPAPPADSAQVKAAAKAPPTGAQPPAQAAPTSQSPKVASINPAPVGESGGPQVWVEAVAATEAGRLVAKGGASPNALVRLYLNGAYLADVTAGPDGRWSLTIERGMTPGPYVIRADVVDSAGGSVAARAEVRFTYPKNPSEGSVLAAAPQSGAVAPASSTPTVPPSAPAKQAASETPAQRAAVEVSPQVAKIAPAPATSARGAVKADGASPQASQAAAASQTEAAPSPTSGQNAPQVEKGATPAPSEKQAAVETSKSADRPSANAVVEVSIDKVVPGDSLWAISRRFYGHGVRFGEIFEANGSQIRDPKLIYPGQIFVVPGDSATP
jgi:nucleoid-associated protein YgaU